MAPRPELSEPGLPARGNATANSPRRAIRHALTDGVPPNTKWCPAADRTVASTAKEAALVTPLPEAEARGGRRDEENRNEQAVIRSHTRRAATPSPGNETTAVPERATYGTSERVPSDTGHANWSALCVTAPVPVRGPGRQLRGGATGHRRDVRLPARRPNRADWCPAGSVVTVRGLRDHLLGWPAAPAAACSPRPRCCSSRRCSSCPASCTRPRTRSDLPWLSAPNHAEYRALRIARPASWGFGVDRTEA